MTYLGYDVLDAANHNMRDAIRSAFTRQGSLLRNVTGKSSWDDAVGQAVPARNLTWTASGRPEIAALRAFLVARNGRLNPFWVPSYGAELPLAADAHAGDSTLKILAIGFSRFLFPVIARRYLAILRPNGAFEIAKITAATDNGDGTETLNLSASLAVDAPKSRLVCFLPLCRLDADMTPIQWHGPLVAEATFPFREVPLEVPA